MLELSLKQLSESLHNKSISPVELTQFYLDRINRHNKSLNAFITVCPELALQQAKVAEKRLANGEAHALTGIPIAHKDIFCTQGIKTTCGSKMLDNFIAPYDATLVAQCRQSGMVMLGKTNMDEFAMGSTNESSYYGVCHNPWQLGYTPGGIFRRLRVRHGSKARPHHYRDRHWRFHTSACSYVWHYRAKTNLWLDITFRHDCFCLQP